MKKLPKVIIRKSRKPKAILPAPHRPRLDDGGEAELLGGEVQGKKASAPEERFAKAISKVPSVDGYEFRRAVNAPRNMPGWKELDYVVSARGIVYAIEVDTEFTHRGKTGRTDVLHDAIVLKDLAEEGMQVYPEVIHLFGESDLVDQTWADRTAKRLFG